MNAITILIAISVAMCLVLGAITIIAHQFSLNRIKSKTVGDGQHGVARFASRSEIQKTYQHIPYQVKQWRNGENLPKEQGIIVGCQKNKQVNTESSWEGRV